MAVVRITNSVGANGKNQAAEVSAVDQLLRKAGVPFRGPRTVAGDIEVFQHMCGLKADGRVDPRGTTLRYLNALTNRPTLRVKDTTFFGKAAPYRSRVSKKTLASGAYDLEYATDDGVSGKTEIPPQPYKLLVGTTQMDAIDVTGRPRRDLIDARLLPPLLKLIEQHNTWGVTLSLKLMIVLDGKVIVESVPQNLQCPVKPHSGQLLSQTENSGMPYNGSLSWGAANEKKFWGRMLKKINGYDKYLFVWPGGSNARLETDPAHRGLDCITYAGAVCGAAHTAMAGRGSDLADSLKTEFEASLASAPLGAAPAKLDNKDLTNAKIKDIEKFFDANPGGHYLMYSTGHVVLVAGATVHEFKPPESKGYTQTPIKTWVAAHSNGWTVTKLSGKPPLANS